MDDGEFTEDAGIQDVNLIDFNDMPHKTNKKAFSMKVQRTNDGSSEYKGRFDFNLFKLIRDNFSDHYTVCLEKYFQKSPFYDYEFGSTVLNINIDTGLTIKVNSEYKYLRTILNLSPDGTSKQIQRRLYVNFKSNFDNDSPVLLPINVLIYGIKGEAKSDLDMSIYDYEKAYEVANNYLQIHIPINMNNNGIRGLPRSPIDDNGPLTRTYMKLVSLPCILVGTTEIGVNTNRFSYELQIDGTTTSITLASILGANGFHVLNVSVTSTSKLNGLYRLVIDSLVNPYVAHNVNTLIYDINHTFHKHDFFQMESTDGVRKRFMYTIFYRIFEKYVIKMYMALYVKDLNGDFVLDDDGNKIEFTVELSNVDIVSTDMVNFSVNSNGHTETDKNLIVKPATADNHVVVKGQVSDIIHDSFIDLWVSEYLRMYSSCTYQMDRADGQTVKMDSSRKVETIYDKSNEESDATQTDTSKRPSVCTKAEKHNGRYFLKFNGSQKMISQVNLNNNAVNVFIVYKLDSRGSAQSYWNNALFGHDNIGYDKFVAYSASNLVVSGANNANKCVYWSCS